MDDDQKYPPATSTPYRTTAPNADIPLYTGLIRVQQETRAVEGQGTVVLRWLPSPRFRFEIADSVMGRLALGDCRVELPDRGWSHGGAVTRIGRGIGGIVDPHPGLAGYLAQRPVLQLRAHVINFHETLGEPLARQHGKGWYSGRHVFDAGDWRLTFDDVEPPRTELRDAGGYVLTHVVVSERRDGAAIDPSASGDLLRTLDLALSCSLGSWTGCTLATGYDAAGALVWEQWRMPWLVPYANEFSWFPAFPARNFGAFVAGFARATEQAPAREALGTCVHWYIEANAGHGGLEGAMTMAFMGLELLSWLDAVVRKGLDPKVFKNTPARRKIRDYLVAQGVPLTATALPKLAAFIASEQDCADGLDAVARLRNRTVHPQGRTFSHDPIALREEAWRYSVYLLERAILKESGYTGMIADRVEGPYTTIT